MFKIDTPKRHWFLDKNKLDEYPYNRHCVDPYGFHHKKCNGIRINNEILCCGQILCFFCKTPLHGCTKNESYQYKNREIYCHVFCYKINKSALNNLK